MRSFYFVIIALLLSSCLTSTSEQLLKLGQQAQIDGDDKAAIIYFKDALVKDGTNAEARLALGVVLAERGDMKSAKRFIEQAVEQGQVSPQALTELARVYFHLNLADELDGLIDRFADQQTWSQLSLKLYQVLLLQRNGQQAMAHVSLNALANEGLDCNLCIFTQAYMTATEDKAAAIHLLSELLDSSPDFADGYLLLGQLQFSLKRYVDAYASFQSFLLKQPQAQYVQFLLAITQLQLSDLHKAEVHIDRLLGINNKHPLSHHLKAIVYFQQRNFELAKRHAEESINLGLDSPANQLMSGISAYQLGTYEQAYMQLGKASEFYAHNQQVKTLLLHTQIKLGYFSDAADSLGELDVGSAKSALLGNYVASNLIRQDKREQASQLLSKLLITPTNSPVATLQTQLLNKTLTDQAKLVAEQSVIKEENAAAELANILLLIELQQFEQALNRAVRWHQLAPDNLQANNALAFAHQSMGQMDEAAEHYLRSLSLDENNVAALLFLGIQLRDANKNKQALDYFRKIFVTQPQHLKAYILALDILFHSTDKQAFADAINLVNESDLSEQMLVVLADRLYALKAYVQIIAILDRRQNRLPLSQMLEQVRFKAMVRSEKKGALLKAAKRLVSNYSDEPSFSFVFSALSEQGYFTIIDELLRMTEAQGVSLDNNYRTLLEAITLVEGSRLEEAERLLQTVAEDDVGSQLPLLHYAKGRLFNAQQKTMLAEFSFKSSLEHLISFEPARYLLDILANEKRISEATTLVDDYLIQFPSDVKMRIYSFNKLSSLAPEFALKVMDCERCQQEVNTNYALANNLAWTNLVTERLDEADRMSALALSLNSQHEQVIINRANVLLKQERYQDSLELLKQLNTQSAQITNLITRLESLQN